MTSCLANIHSFVLRDCAQLPWAGDLSEDININQVKVEKKKDQQIVKFLPAKVPNLPYSKVILQEKIKWVYLNILTTDMKLMKFPICIKYMWLIIANIMNWINSCTVYTRL